jgi:hypothetical protein
VSFEDDAGVGVGAVMEGEGTGQVWIGSVQTGVQALLASFGILGFCGTPCWGRRV